jgi:ABC-type dipeptide/oligopeptide/nickel transport system permease subunit
MRRQRVLLVAAAIAVFGLWLTLMIAGLRIPDEWATQPRGGGFIDGRITLPPFPAFTTVSTYPLNQPTLDLRAHYYLLGSDAGGRDLLALTARGAIPSFELVAVALAARMLIGIVAGMLMAGRVTLVRTAVRGIGSWIAGFPYLALAVLVIQAFTGGSSVTSPANRARLVGFVVAIGVVGWRDIAEVVSGRALWVRSQEFALGATAVGTTSLGFFRRHVWPYLRPALMVELSFQAGAVLVLLAELGFLQYYIGGFTGLAEDLGNGGTSTAFHLANQPELGQLLADARTYTLRQELLPALVPAMALALAALAFELLGRAFRGRADLPT